MMGWDVKIVEFMVTLFTVRRASFIPTTPIIAALLGRTAIAWLQSTVRICLPLIHNCIIISLINGFGFPPLLYVTNFLANV